MALMAFFTFGSGAATLTFSLGFHSRTELLSEPKADSQSRVSVCCENVIIVQKTIWPPFVQMCVFVCHLPVLYLCVEVFLHEDVIIAILPIHFFLLLFLLLVRLQTFSLEFRVVPAV